MIRLIHFVTLFTLFIVVVFATLWGSMAMWFKLPGPDGIRWAVLGAFMFFGVATLVAIFKPVRWRWLSVFAATLVVFIAWWNTLVPPTDSDWPAEVSRQVTGSIQGDILTLENVRAFEWRTTDDYIEVWETRTYDVTQIESIDLFLSFWGSPSIGHFMLSFGFSDERFLTFSDEVRRTEGVSFSPIADFFKANPIIMIASEEYDVVGLRSNIRKERVQIFRVRSDPDRRRALLAAYVKAANSLIENPRWFNSAFTNCSRSAIQLARHVGANLPADWRILVNGFFPDYLYERGAMNTDFTLDEIFSLGDITERANAVGLTEEYSAAIRQGVPAP